MTTNKRRTAATTPATTPTEIARHNHRQARAQADYNDNLRFELDLALATRGPLPTSAQTGGHKDTDSAALNRATVTKSGNTAPLSSVYSADRETPATAATSARLTLVASSAVANASATSRAATTAAGASATSGPAGNDAPATTHRRGGASDAERAMHTTVADTANGVLQAGRVSEDLTDVRSGRHTESNIRSISYGPAMTPTTARTATVVVPAAQRTDLAPDLLALLNAPVPTTTGPGFATRVSPPSAGQRRQCYLALAAVREAISLDSRRPGDVLAAALTSVTGGNARADRTRALLHARTLLTHLPTRTRLIPTAAITAARARLSGAEPVSQPAAAGLYVSTPDGSVLALENHPARRPGGTVDDWMRTRVAAHLALGAHLPGFAGVLLATPRCDAASAHITADTRHVLGGCTVCAVTA